MFLINYQRLFYEVENSLPSL